MGKNGKGVHPGHTIRCMKDPVYRAIVSVLVTREKEHHPDREPNQGFIGSVAKRILGALRSGHYINDEAERKAAARAKTEIASLRTALRAKEAEVGRLRGALEGLHLEEALTFEGNMEAHAFFSVDALNAARAALGEGS